MPSANPPDTEKSTVAGVMLGASSYLIWGISPVYWKVLHEIPALEIIAHRIVWSFVLLFVLTLFLKQWPLFTTALKNRRNLTTLTGTALLVSTNWLVYIWAVNHDRLLQASLGYYINPLVNVLLGMLFLKERLRPAQALAVVLAAGGVFYLTFFYGAFPWVSIVLAFSFGFYGLIRKMAPVKSLTGLSVETMLLSVPGVIYLMRLNAEGSGAFLHGGLKIDLLLMGTALLTATPLLFFNMGAKRLNYSTMGFLQYIAPTCMFLLGVFVYHEPFLRAQVISFVLIWTALSIYSTDSVRTYRAFQKKHATTPRL